MEIQPTISEQILFSTTKISCFSGKEATGTGTGFFFNFDIESGDLLPAIVTNKHVISGCTNVSFSLPFEVDGKHKGHSKVDIDLKLAGIIEHPNEDVDLCAILVGKWLKTNETKGKKFSLTFLDRSLIPSIEEWQRFDALEPILMVGCPRGIFDSYNNLPIFRSGYTSTSLSKNYMEKDEFLIDMACFPGSSGSPILIYNQIGYHDKKTGGFEIGKQRIRLVGILYSGPLIGNKGEIILGATPFTYTNTMMHLGQAIKSYEIQKLQDIVDRVEFQSAS